MKEIGIKLADGTFHPILEEGTTKKQELNLTTASDDQTLVQVHLYRRDDSSPDEAEYVDTLELSHIKKHPNGEPNLNLKIWVDQDSRLSAELVDKESGAEARTSVSLLDENSNENTDMLNEGGGVMLADSEEKNELDDTTSMDLDLPDLDLPDDFGEPAFDDEPAADTTSIDTSMDFDAGSDSNTDSELDEEKLDFSDTDFDLPDFNDDMSSTTTDTSSSSSSDFDPFGDDPFSDDDSSDPFADSGSSSSSGGGLDFSDLYNDEEGGTDENGSGKSQKLTMVICLVCAIVCVLAVLAMFFVTASKFNLFNIKNIFNKNKQQVVEAPAPVQAEPVQEKPLAPPAKEDEVVVIKETENVVPDFPKEEEKPKPKEIKYKVKWGDTLWDLADAYYKNPWLYPKIAKYNNIKNPNYIVAGTYILIPEE